MEKHQRILATYDLITGDARGQYEDQILHLARTLTESRNLLTDATDPVEAEEAALSYMHQFALLRQCADSAIESISLELLARRVPQQDIANAAGVHRVTVARWKRAQREQRQQSANES